MRKPSDQQIKEGMDAFIRQMLDVSVRLVRIEDNVPCSGGSGFIYEKSGRHTLFSVLHNFRPDKAKPDDLQFGGWYLETALVVDNQSLVLSLPPIEFVTQVHFARDCEARAEHVDFVCGHLDVYKLREKAAADAKLKGKKLELPVYRGAINVKPDKIHGYGFASFSETELVGNNPPKLMRYPVSEIGMAFDGYDDRGLCRFKLAGKHKGHAKYHGSSGSPIADDEGNIVALVQGGDNVDGIIFGLPLHQYAHVIEIPS
jgi:hypothetical protein